MMKKTFVLSAFLTGLFTLSALAQVPQSTDRDDRNTLVKFDGGIGVLPVASAVGRSCSNSSVRSACGGRSTASSSDCRSCSRPSRTVSRC